MLVLYVSFAQLLSRTACDENAIDPQKRALAVEKSQKARSRQRISLNWSFIYRNVARHRHKLDYDLEAEIE